MRRQAGERHPPGRRGPLAPPRPERHDLPAEHRQRHTTAAALRGCAGVCRAGEKIRPLPGEFAGWGSAGPKSAGAAAPLAGRLAASALPTPRGTATVPPRPATPGAAPPPSNPVRQMEERQRSAQLNRILMQRRSMAAKHHPLP